MFGPISSAPSKMSMRRDPRAFLWDAREGAKAIAEYTEGKTFADYMADGMLRSAVERQFEIVGEALSQLSKIDPKLASRIEALPKAVGFRNVLIHGYATIRHEIVWRTIKDDLPGLGEQAAALLRELGEAP